MKDWLAQQRPGGPKRSFGTALYAESKGWAAAGAPEIMARLLEESTTNGDLVRDLAKHLRWSKKRVRNSIVAKMQPTNEKQKEGKFGEVLHAKVLGVFQGMTVVSKKYRYNPAPNAPVHGVDLIALAGATGGGQGERVVYAETKLRTVRDGGALIKAYEGLVKINDVDISASLAVEFNLSYKNNPDMFKRLVVAARRQKKAHYRIGAVFEESAWSDSYLDRLGRRHDPDSLDMAVDIVKIRSLRSLVQESYKRVK